MYEAWFYVWYSTPHNKKSALIGMVRHHMPAVYPEYPTGKALRIAKKHFNINEGLSVASVPTEHVLEFIDRFPKDTWEILHDE